MRQRINKYIHFYLSPRHKIVGWIFTILGFIGMTITLYLFSQSDLEISEISFEDDAIEKGTALNYYLPYLLPGLASAIFLLVGLVALLTRFLRKRKIIRLLMRNDPVQATVISNIQNFHVQVNNIPRREVVFKTLDGNTYEFRFYSEHMANVLREHTTLEIITNRKKAYPFISFFEQVTGDSKTDHEDNMVHSARRKADSTNSSDSGFDSFIEGAANFEKAGNIEAAISFYEGALQFKQDKMTARKLIALYRTTGERDKAEAMEKASSNW